MENKKSYEHPKSGVFYMVPDPKKPGTYTITSETQEEGGEDVAHLFLFDHVKKQLQSRFKAPVEDLDAYTGVPRGRIIEPRDINGDWIIAHGDDFPLDTYRNDIISEFSLRDAFDLGKVRFEVDQHEKMSPKERKEVESALGIEYTSTGWKKIK